MTSYACHLVFPDSQIKPGVPTDFMEWVGRYIADSLADRPNLRVIHLGDHADMPSLSMYDKPGSKEMEGRRYSEDIKSANEGFARFAEQIIDVPCDRHILLGNHENRINRAISADPVKLEGVISMDHLNYKEWGFKVHDFLEVPFIDGVGYCLAPHHRVLTRDLRWVAVGDLKVGDDLWGIEEEAEGPGLPRRHCSSTVLQATPAAAPLFRVELRSGQTFDATREHRWLARSRGASQWKWLHTYELTPNHEICRVTPTWNEDRSYDAGWLAGMFDGEGWLSKPNCAQGGIQLGLAQNAGPVLNHLEALLAHLPHTTYVSGRDCRNIRIGGRSVDKLAVLGTYRPRRILEKLQPEMLGRVQMYGDRTESRVSSVTPIGEGDMVMLQTSSKTLIVDGYAHHNSHYAVTPMTGRPMGGSALLQLGKLGHSMITGHQQTLDYAVRYTRNDKGQMRSIHRIIAGASYTHHEDYLGPQGNEHWRGIIVLNEVRAGSFDPLFVSMDYLCRRYTGRTLRDYQRRHGFKA